jgi:GDP-4-dehydro-6-deoxy-D-mannose reductase
MRVLITGAGGFAGRHMVDLAAAEGAEVLAANRSGEPVVGATATVRLDLLDREATRAALRDARADRVFHLAAEASVAASWRDASGTIRRNLEMTTSLLDAVEAETPGATVLIAGSGEVYGPPLPGRLPVDEDHPLRPQNPYAVSKATVDLTAGWYSDAGRVQTVRARAFNHAGPGQSGAYVVGGFVERIAELLDATPHDEPLVLRTGNTKARRDFTDVRDVVRAYWQLAAKGEPGPFNVCSGHAMSVQGIVDELGRRLGRKIVQRDDPALMRPLDVPEIRGSHARLTEAVGWTPVIPFAQTLADALEAAGAGRADAR